MLYRIPVPYNTIAYAISNHFMVVSPSGRHAVLRSPARPIDSLTAHSNRFMSLILTNFLPTIQLNH